MGIYEDKQISTLTETNISFFSWKTFSKLIKYIIIIHNNYKDDHQWSSKTKRTYPIAFSVFLSKIFSQYCAL